MIDIHTTTIGREFYLKRQIESLIRNCGDFNFIHRILFQGKYISFNFESFLSSLPSEYKYKIYHVSDILSVGQTIDWFKDKFKYDLILKLDDDAKIVSENFIRNALNIHKIYPAAVFSPYPVGLINNPGGVRSKTHHVVYSKENDIYFTFRKVNHVGGFARFSPKKYILECDFSNRSHTEDGDFSNYCNQNNIDRFYLENDLIVEHQESTLGQHQRLGEDYFKQRF